MFLLTTDLVRGSGELGRGEMGGEELSNFSV